MVSALAIHLLARPLPRPLFPLLCNTVHNLCRSLKTRTFHLKAFSKQFSYKHTFFGLHFSKCFIPRTRSMLWLFILIVFRSNTSNTLGNGAFFAVSIGCDQVKPVPLVEEPTWSPLWFGEASNIHALKIQMTRNKTYCWVYFLPIIYLYRLH